jgi:hypothetical protein
VEGRNEPAESGIVAKVKNGEGEAVKAVSTATGREPAKAAEKCPTGNL